MKAIGRLVVRFSFIALALLVAAPAAPQSVAKVDPRALAMGGGYVAVADGWAALQWNPAGMWVSGRNEAAVTAGDVPLEAGPWIESLRVAAGRSSVLDPARAAATLSSSESGLVGERTFGAYVISPRFGGGFQQISYVNEGDTQPLGEILLDQAALRTREVLFSVAQPLAQGRVALGASAKIVQAQGRYQRSALAGITLSGLSARALLADARAAPTVAEKTVFAVDVGVLVMASAKVRIGGVVKNLNAPTLDAQAPIEMRLPRQVRVGGLFLPHPRLKLTLDLDLIADSFIEGLRNRREL
ncbi:MAG: conjugal transfer protein TraF, partial [Acidobacteriota bacterium]